MNRYIKLEYMCAEMPCSVTQMVHEHKICDTTYHTDSIFANICEIARQANFQSIYFILFISKTGSWISVIYFSYNTNYSRELQIITDIFSCCFSCHTHYKSQHSWELWNYGILYVVISFTVTGLPLISLCTMGWTLKRRAELKPAAA